MVSDIWANWLLLKKSQRMLNALEGPSYLFIDTVIVRKLKFFYEEK